MDNLTHSLAGLVTAEVIIQVRARTGDVIDPRWARSAWLASVAAQNVPDADFVYTWITEPTRLGYLLHHRGHTHTLALVPLMAAIPYLLAWAWSRRRGERWSPTDHAWMALVVILGPLAHMALDYSNNYGVHPFWPFSSAWMSGDSIFIVEPLFWACTIPPILVATGARRARIAWAVVLAIGLLAPWLAPFVAWPFAAITTAIGVGMLAISFRVGEGARAALALSSSLAVLATFLACGAIAEARFVELLAREHPDDETLDVVRAPVPTVAPCWEMIAIQRSRTSDDYALRLARVSAFPWLVPVELCSRAARGPLTAEAIGAERDVLRRDGVWIEAELRGPRASLREIDARCDGAAYLRFARAPFVVARGDQLVLGDLRYDREESLGFAEMEVAREAPAVCPRFVPPWAPWRADLLTDPEP